MADTVDCVFCAIAEGHAPAHRIYEDDLSLAILDINPLAEGHCLVIPRRHVPWWQDMTAEETASLFEVARTVARRQMETLAPDFVCTYARGRRVPHTHLFLVPTRQGDPLDRYFSSLEAFQETAPELASLRESEALQDVAMRLRTGTANH